MHINISEESCSAEKKSRWRSNKEGVCTVAIGGSQNGP